MGIKSFTVILLVCGSFFYVALCDDIATLLETLDDIKDQEETDDLEHNAATNTEDNDQILRELADITDILERTTENDEELTATNDGSRDATDSEDDTTTETQAMLADLDALTEDVQQEQKQIAYNVVGCYKDNQVDPRPLPELLADLTSEIDWYHIDKVILKCAQLASEKGYSHFGLQSFGHCRSGKDAASTYNRDGNSSGCKSGLGGVGENLVFTITPLQSSTPLPMPKPTTVPSECRNYVTLNSSSRSMNFNDSVSSCDDKLPRGWYRFDGPAGNKMPTSCVPTHHCDAHAPGWLVGSHPAAYEGKVRREVCFHWKSCCSWRNSVLVRNCGSFFVYDLSPTLTCNLRYCGNGQETTTPPPTTAPTTTTTTTITLPETTTARQTTASTAASSTTTTSPETSTLASTTEKSSHAVSSTVLLTPIPLECLKYKLLSESNRAEGYPTNNRPAICDKALSRGWYRFSGEAGDKMPDFCVTKLRCGTHAPGWLNTPHPSVADGIVNGTVCFHWGSNCCYWSTGIRVRNCGGFFVYELHRVPYCSLRYCGNNRQVPMMTTTHSPTTTNIALTPPIECSSYRVLSDADRSQNYQYQAVQGAKPTCDRWLPKAWYRFSGLAGDKMPEYCVPTRRCGTLAPGWLQGGHPSVYDGLVSRTVCFHWGRKCCGWRRRISVRNCGDFYIYNLQKAPVCKLRYCGVGQIATPKPTTTRTPTTRLTPTTTPLPTKPNYGFVIACLPSGMHVRVSREHLPFFVNPSLLSLADPNCGVIKMDDKEVMLATKLDSCGTTRRTDDDRVSFHNKIVAASGMGNKRSFFEFPFRCTYKKLSSLGQLNTFQPLFKRGQVMDSTFD